MGAVEGKPSEVEKEPVPLIDRLRASVSKGGSAVVLLAAPEHVDAMVAALADDAGELTRHRLSDDEAATLEAALTEAPNASGGPTGQGGAAAAEQARS